MSDKLIVCRSDQLNDLERLQTKVAVVANPAPAEIRSMPNLVWVQSLWAGVEGLLHDGISDSLKVVRLVDDRLSETMAEAVLAWSFYLHRDMPLYRQQQDKTNWAQHPVKLCRERSIGVLGLGKLGSFECLAGEQGLSQLLESSQILVVLLPLTTQTRGLLSAERLAMLSPGASLINFARGPIVDDQALLECLDSRHLNHAVLDVFDQEPLPITHPFWQHPDVTVLPHISAPTDKPSASRLVAGHLSDYFNEGRIPDAVDLSKGY